MICDSMCIKLFLYSPASGPPSKIVMILMKQDFYDDSSDSRGQDHSRKSRIIMIQCIVIFPCKYVTVIHLFLKCKWDTSSETLRSSIFFKTFQENGLKHIETVFVVLKYLFTIASHLSDLVSCAKRVVVIRGVQASAFRFIRCPALPRLSFLIAYMVLYIHASSVDSRHTVPPAMCLESDGTRDECARDARGSNWVFKSHPGYRYKVSLHEFLLQHGVVASIVPSCHLLCLSTPKTSM